MNGKRPKGGSDRYDGEGFGGGRGANRINLGFTYGRNMDVIPGCVLIEI